METKTLKESNYPWVVCAILFMFAFIGIGLCNSTYGTHMPYIMKEFGITNTQSSLQVSFRSFASLGTLAVLVPTFKKLKIKLVALLALVSGIVGWVVLSMAQSIEWCYAGSIFLGITFAAAGMTTITAFVRNWFVKHKGLVVGIITAGTGLCGTVIPPIQRALIEGYSLKVCFLFEAAITAVMLLIIFFFVKDTPQEMGLYPLGGKDAVAQEEQGFKKNEKYSAKIVSHVLICIFLICLGGFNYNAWGHLSMLYTGAGWDSAWVAGMLSFAGFVLIPTKIAYGIVSDKCDARKTAWIFFGADFIAMIMWWLLVDIKIAALQFFIIILYDIGGVYASTGISVISMDLSNEKNCKTIAALYLLVYNLGSMITAPVIGWIADLNGGSYGPSYLFLGVLTAIGYVCTMAAYSLAEKNALKEAQTNA